MLPRRRRLSRAGFSALQRARKAQSPHLSLSWSTGTGMAVVVSKKVAARAVDRHLLKRRIMSVLARHDYPHIALVVFAKAGSPKLPFPVLRQELEKLLHALG